MIRPNPAMAAENYVIPDEWMDSVYWDGVAARIMYFWANMEFGCTRIEYQSISLGIETKIYGTLPEVLP